MSHPEEAKVSIDYGTCPTCGREKVHLNVLTGKLIGHLQPGQKESCPGSHTPPAESRARKT
jgi:hypothetical protein